MTASHIPVMRVEMLAALSPRAGGVYVDGTFGAGGYSEAILQSADCTVIAIDRDPNAIASGRALVETYGTRLVLMQGRIGDISALARPTLDALGRQGVDGVVLDLGVSSMQLDDGTRGFSFMRDGPLDMRMSQSGVSAADICNQAEEGALARIIAVYGEERRARTIAKAITAARTDAPLRKTKQLADIVARVFGARPQKLHPATRTFQALRIFINDELAELAQALEQAETLLAPEGRLAVVSFHSLEDRIVKKFLAQRSGRQPRPSRHSPSHPAEAQASFASLQRRGQTPSAAEIAANPRARSARLRSAMRSDAPPLNDDTHRFMPRGVPSLDAFNPSGVQL